MEEEEEGGGGVRKAWTVSGMESKWEAGMRAGRTADGMVAVVAFSLVVALLCVWEVFGGGGFVVLVVTRVRGGKN